MVLLTSLSSINMFLNFLESLYLKSHQHVRTVNLNSFELFLSLG